MEVIAIGLFVYVALGGVVSAFTYGRSMVDTVLDVVLWPVIIYYFAVAEWRVRHARISK